MAEIKHVEFLRGQSSSLSTIIAPEDGVFYLTEDTHKLHVGLLNDNGTTSIYELNKDITIYSDLVKLKADLANKIITPHEGSFFYLEEQNIFCIYSDEDFIQINPDTGVTGIDDNRSTEKDENGLSFSTQPITGITYNPTTRKLIVTSGDKFVTVDMFKTALEEINTAVSNIQTDGYLKSTDPNGFLMDSLGNTIILDCGGLE